MKFPGKLLLLSCSPKHPRFVLVNLHTGAFELGSGLAYALFTAITSFPKSEVIVLHFFFFFEWGGIQGVEEIHVDTVGRESYR